MDNPSPWAARTALEPGHYPSSPTYQPAPAPSQAPAGDDPFGRPRKSLRSKLGALLAALAALGAKFFTVLKAAVLLLPKAKLLTTSGTALLSVAAYSLFFGWTFAIGFVVLLFVHEMGHVIQLRREGIKASAPMFIPFLGAVVSARSLGDNAVAEARVGLAGPVLGTLGSAVVLGIYAITGSPFWEALAYIGFFINLFNLIPLTPLDGGRAMAAIAPAMWFVGFGVLVALFFVLPHNGILLLFIVLGGYDLYRRWQQRRSRTLESAAYYRVKRRDRILVTAVYLGLVLALAAGMAATFVHHTI